MSELPQGQPFAADFRVGDWLVEPSLDRLSRNGTVRHLRPQLTNLLVLLAQNAGRTVSKDEILSKVWDGQFVAESGMTRCIAEIRQALGDDARDPRIVQTITKRGYRLVAPVSFLPPSPAAEAAVAPTVMEAVVPLAAPPPAMDTMPCSPAVVPGAAAVSVSRPGVASDEVAPVPSHRVLRNAAWSLASALGLVVVAALVWAVSGWVKRPVLTERDTVLLADVLNTTGDAAFDQTLRLALGVHLGQAPFLRILPESRMRAALPLMSRPPETPVTGAVALEVCRREGAAVLLAGSVARVGSHYVVGLEALACSDGETVARQLLEVNNKDDVLGALGTAAGRIRRTLGESRASLRRYDVPIVEATTPSLEALKALSLGDIARDHSRLPEALMHYRQATELDPQFALAWARRGAAAQSMGQMLGDDRSGETNEILIAFQTAYELRDRVSEVERLYILGHYYRFVRADPEKAIETYRLWSRTYRESMVPATNTSSIYVNTFGRYEEGLADAREAVRLAPSSSLANGMLIAACRGANRLAEARQALESAARQGADDLAWHRLAFEAAFADGDRAGMQEHVRWAARDPLASVVLTEHGALAAVSGGRLHEARRLWAEATANAARFATVSVRAGILLRQAEAEALLGDAAAARAAADAALEIDGQALTRLAAAAVFALVGDARRAMQLLQESGHGSGGPMLTALVWRAVARGLVQAEVGRPDEALEALGSVVRFERGRHFGLVPLGARGTISLRSGRAKEAAEAFGALVELRHVLPLSPWVPFARLGLARALRDAGDIAGSRAAYDALIGWMKDADQNAPILIAARRERGALG